MIWRSGEILNGYENLYQISNLGNVKSLSRYIRQKNNSKKLVKGKILKPIKTKKGYLAVALSKEGKEKRFYIHRLVAQEFIINKEYKKEVNHIDENPLNNKVDNLEWVNHIQNMNHGTRNKRISIFMENWCKNNRCKKVKQLDLKRKMIEKYSSITEASKKTGISIQNISHCITGRNKTTNGFIFELVEE